MVEGLQSFADQFKDLKDCYILIGGAACDLWLGDRGLGFRRTRDLDIVLIVDKLHAEFFTRFWAFIRGGRYKSHQGSETRPPFYRFREPQADGYPFMIELLSRNHLDIPAGVHLTPLPGDGDISSLSAILLDETYYQFLLVSRMEVGGIPTVPAKCLIPLKARAHLDLAARKERGDQTVRGEDIKKHRNDVFRLYRALAPQDRFDLPGLLRDDLARFLDTLPPGSADWSAIRQAIGQPALPPPEQVIRQLRDIFRLGTGSTGIAKSL